MGNSSEIESGFRAVLARSGLPKNRACLLIMPPRARRGISGDAGVPGDAPKESSSRFNKKETNKTAG
jgi:hypothetical protein